jgi:hypothetical protein
MTLRPPTVFHPTIGFRLVLGMSSSPSCLPVRRIISLVLTPSALSSTISARQTYFCVALRSVRVPSIDGDQRLEGMDITVRIRPDLHACTLPEIPPGVRREI